MPRPRVTIAASMAVVAFAALGVAALRGANASSAAATFTLAVLAVSAACAGALVRRGVARAPWAGFAASGLACLIIWLWAGEAVGYVHGTPRLLAFWGLRYLRPCINPEANGGKS
jgi:hypothetical protein